ncbi:MAG: ABC transporter ATP-binding protein [Acidobacteriota bacterium]|nr:ABC transporter ATP-binding protein [Acidobacteriota bacterium]
MSEPLLAIDGLTVEFPSKTGALRAVDGVTFSLRRGETLGLVGESGSGKSMTALAAIGLVPPPGRVAEGSVRFDGRTVTGMPERELRRIRGAGIGFVFQEPMTALNPVFTIGAQLVETLEVHAVARGRAARAKAAELLAAVRLPEPERRLKDYPHQLSGGQRQRALIAMALACSPALLIADEPTTALDVTVQAEILDLLREMKSAFGLALLLITHDLGVVAETADRVAVMYAGRIVEQAPVAELFADPLHPYTRGLLASMPGREQGRQLRAIPGVVPPLGNLPPGCAFAPRCPDRFEPCDKARPGDAALPADRLVKCYLHDSPMLPARGGAR